MNYWFVDKL